MAYEIFTNIYTNYTKKCMVPFATCSLSSDKTGTGKTCRAEGEREQRVTVGGREGAAGPNQRGGTRDACLCGGAGRTLMGESSIDRYQSFLYFFMSSFIVFVFQHNHTQTYL